MVEPNRDVERFGGGRGQLSHDVAAHIREAIIVGRFKARQFIRTESIAAEMGVSATPVREALMALQSEGSVIWRPRRGFEVASISQRDIQDLFGVQAYIAGELAARAAHDLTDQQLASLRREQEALEAATAAGNSTDVDRHGHTIHRMINSASGSTRLMMLLNQTVQFAPMRAFGSLDGWAKDTAHDHTDLIDALERRDADGARAAMSAHILHIGELLVEYLADIGHFQRS